MGWFAVPGAGTAVRRRRRRAARMAVRFDGLWQAMACCVRVQPVRAPPRSAGRPSRAGVN